MSLFFKLDGEHNLIPCTCEEWGAMLQEKGSKRVAFDVIDGMEISTVFLGLDHNHFGGTPILFETMIFKDRNDDIYQSRYHTWDEAVKGHQTAMEWVKNGCKDEQN